MAALQKKKLTFDQAREAICRYCSYQERSHQETRNKLYSYGLYSSQVEELLSYLITEGFLNEERFARAYAGGKFRMMDWGRVKIIQGLKAKGVSKTCISLGLKEIESETYEKSLEKVLQKKLMSLENEANKLVIKDKLARFAIQKGFEPELVWQKIKDALPNS